MPGLASNHFLKLPLASSFQKAALTSTSERRCPSFGANVGSAHLEHIQKSNLAQAVFCP
jgi:hypothetical protein